MKPFAFTSSKTEAGVKIFPQLVSSGIPSSVFPKFHPGFMFAMNDEAEIDVKAVGQAAAVELVDDELTAVVLVLLVVVNVVAVLEVLDREVVDEVVDEVVAAVPGTHCE